MVFSPFCSSSRPMHRASDPYLAPASHDPCDERGGSVNFPTIAFPMSPMERHVISVKYNGNASENGGGRVHLRLECLLPNLPSSVPCPLDLRKSRYGARNTANSSSSITSSSIEYTTTKNTNDNNNYNITYLRKVSQRAESRSGAFQKAKSSPRQLPQKSPRTKKPVDGRITVSSEKPENAGTAGAT